MRFSSVFADTSGLASGLASGLVVPLVVFLAGAAGCGDSGRKVNVADDAAHAGGPGDNSDVDLLRGPPNACGDYDPTCTGLPFGPPTRPFPLPGDPQPDPNVSADGVDRDPDGFLGLGTTRATFDFLWIANMQDWGIGTVSKINSKTIKEVARYSTVTCFSLATGSKAACDGTKGCCSIDDHQRYLNRTNNQPSGLHQAVQRVTNHPSRTAVDFNGDVWVANRAFGGQSSASKIANDLSECVDRNGTPGIQTSSDVNGDGVIDTDCNRNGVIDDLDDVKAAACVNGKPQEYYGIDDECILFTTNTNIANQFGRPLALGRGAADAGPADAWAGTFQDGKFFRIDGTSGTIKSSALVATNPYGAVVDAKGVLWATGVAGGPLTYFDTGNPGVAGVVRMPPFGIGGYGITLDRDQNVWIGGYPNPHAYRYTPKRNGAFADLGKGFWTVVNNPGANSGSAGCQGRGIAADSRTPNDYFVWMACHGNPMIVRIDASKIPVPVGMDVQVDGSAMPGMTIAGGATGGAGVDVQQNVWSVSYTGSVVTRILVDMSGNMTKPNIAGPFNKGCPAGDACGLQLAGVASDPNPYTYSDFTGFGLRNFTNPKGSYQYLLKGCGPNSTTTWKRVVWDAVTPPNTSLTARVRLGDTPFPTNMWGLWSNAALASPADITGAMPNPAQYLQVEFDFGTTDRAATPKLKSFTAYYECGGPPG